MHASMNTGIALVQAGALLALSVAVRIFCARRVTLEMVPTALRPRVLRSSRMAPVLLLFGGGLVTVGALVGLASR
ncbi:hypothetical protein [Nocardioides sp.]|uniref:hypothetical protein n=1 Tax=Nocardioides sp. TaxID=35761 RepID=UPI0031FE6F35|nr:hypothetical protein [Nocardioides sp.]